MKIYTNGRFCYNCSQIATWRLAVTHFSFMVHIVTIFCNCQTEKVTLKWFININSMQLVRITQRSTGRQKQAHFLPVDKLLPKERSHFKSNSFFAFAACELSR